MTERNDPNTRRAQRRAQGPSDKQASAPPAEDQATDDIGEASAEQRIRDRNARIREKAAAERRARREQQDAEAAGVPIGLDAGERMDDIFVRTTHAAAKWLRANFRWLQWVVTLLVLGGLGWQGYKYHVMTRNATAADALMGGVAAEEGTLADDPPPAEEEDRSIDIRPSFRDDAQRLSTAEENYRTAWTKHANTGSGWLARLGLAGVLFDQKKWNEAYEHYRAVRNSPLAKESPEINGRALEGMGFALEAKGDRKAALSAYQELTNQEGAQNLSTWGLYHQARLLLAEGNRDKAKELALKAQERLTKEAKEPGRAHLTDRVAELVSAIDPSLAKPDSRMQSLEQLLQQDPERLRELLGGMSPGNMPIIPLEAPTEESPEPAAPEPSPTASSPAPTTSSPAPSASSSAPSTGGPNELGAPKESPKPLPSVPAPKPKPQAAPTKPVVPQAPPAELPEAPPPAPPAAPQPAPEGAP